MANFSFINKFKNPSLNSASYQALNRKLNELFTAVASNFADLNTTVSGTFTPELADAATGGNTATFTNLTGLWQRIGDMVFVDLILRACTANATTSANDLYVRDAGSDLPAPYNYFGPLRGEVRHSPGGLGANLMIEQAAPATAFRVWDGSTGTYQTCAWLTVGGTTYFRASFSYQTS